MREVTLTLEIDRCRGQFVGEDNEAGACRTCVELCPEVFERTQANPCARIRLSTQIAPYLDRVQRAVAACPVEAIRLEVRTTRAE